MVVGQVGVLPFLVAVFQAQGTCPLLFKSYESSLLCGSREPKLVMGSPDPGL